MDLYCVNSLNIIQDDTQVFWAFGQNEAFGHGVTKDPWVCLKKQRETPWYHQFHGLVNHVAPLKQTSVSSSISSLCFPQVSKSTSIDQLAFEGYHFWTKSFLEVSIGVPAKWLVYGWFRGTGDPHFWKPPYSYRCWFSLSFLIPFVVADYFSRKITLVVVVLNSGNET